MTTPPPDPWNNPNNLRPKLRFAAQEDAEAVSALLTDSFGGPEEARIVAQLEEDQDLLFTIVAESAGLDVPGIEGAGPLVGSISFSHVEIDDPARDRPVRAAALAPLAVATIVRARGVGTALIRTGLMHCRKRGVEAVLVLGHQKIYMKTGFSVAAAEHVAAPWSGPNFMAQNLSREIVSLRGRARYGAAFGET